MTLTFDLDLEKFSKGQNFWNIPIKENSPKYAWILWTGHNLLLATSKVKVKGKQKGQIHLISYNFTSNCHRDFKLGSYFSFLRAAPNMTLTLIFDPDLEKCAQGQNFGNIN